MSVSLPASAPIAPLRVAERNMALPVLALIVLVLCVPLLAASPANLTSDESLYLAEAYNIAHREGATYPSGDAIVHRAPLFPAMLAPFVKLAGPDAAYAVTKAIVVVNALLVMLLAFRMAGTLAGAVAGVSAAGAAYLNGLGTTLYLDPLECTFMLLAVLAIERAMHRNTLRWWAAAGALAGGALLVKEAAVQWVPLGVVAWLLLPSMRTRAGAVGAALFTGAFAAVVAPWWAWVWLHDSSIYLLGGDNVLRLDLIVGATSIAVLVLFALALTRLPIVRRLSVERAAAPLAVLIVLAWCALLFYGIEAHSGWKAADHQYWRTIPDYFLTVAPQAQPYFALAIAWVWIGWRAIRGDDHARLIFAVSALFMPFALHAANRALQLRDLLPIIYLSYVALGLAAAWGVRALANTLSHRSAQPLLATALAVLGAIFVLQQASAFRTDSAAAAAIGVDASSWDSGFVRENAAWMSEHLPEGANVLTSRLYFSSLHVHTDARFHIYQLPTVRVDVDPRRSDMLVPASNLFRWGENDVRPYNAGDRWIYLRQFPHKAYWIALSQGELMDYIDARDVEYVALSGDDMTFSSLGYASYFSTHPAFELMYHERHSHADQFFVYRVDRSRLGVIDYPLTTSPSSLDVLLEETGLTQDALERKLGVPVRVSDLEHGISPREELDVLGGSAR